MAQSQTVPTLETEHLPEIVPILPLFDAVLFPKMVLPLMVMQKESVQLVDEAMAANRILGLTVARRPMDEDFDPARDMMTIGAGALILKMAKPEEDKAQLLVQGVSRFKIEEFVEGKDYLRARISYLQEEEARGTMITALMSNLVEQFTKVVEMAPALPDELLAMAKSIQEPGTLADMVSATVNAKVEEKQKILEILDVQHRLKEATRLISQQVELLELGNKIQTQVKGDMDQKQREYYLREQLKAIREELGETDDESVEVNEYRAKIDEKNLPGEARKEAERELARLGRMHPSSSEYTVASTYLDWLTALPWNEASEDNLDIAKARKILDEDHYGLEKPKKRIIEYLAVRKLNPEGKSPILCFTGPPGTGKTSLGMSIARAIGRKFHRIALGGVRDEAEIRGHRRTYVGALPGRIIQGLRRAESNNPVFMLDEIDKVGSDFRGDPSSALLEVLDPEQNDSFTDHYLDVPFDLSRVMFITTANVLDTIPPALRDRMEVLRLHGYTEDEKIKIANKYLIPRQRKAHGLTAKNITITRGALRLIITGYTREAGLRNLEREIASVCRGVAAAVAAEETVFIKVTKEKIPDYLGPVQIMSETSARITSHGIAVGLAWTPVGGDVLYIEATAMPGKGAIHLTGQLGDVMKESAMAARSFIRSNIKKLKIPEEFFEKNDIHIHVPAGAIPKDGPSAGVTMLTALASLATERPMKKHLAMTGEITLRGQVLPVGGIKEKVLAAHRIGIRELILPKWNEKDIIDIPEKVRDELTFHFEEKMTRVLSLALQGP